MEDGESAEMIEKKFEALEQYNKEVLYPVETKHEKPVHVDGELSKQQMEDMFKRTSYFSVKNASADVVIPDIEMSDEMEDICIR